MAEGGLIESIKKPPFANYDIVVYFGAGLFLIPFVNRYIVEPMAAKWPNFEIEVGSKIAKEATSILSLLFFIYIVGHILAYLSSQVIEKSADRILGKISTSIIISSIAQSKNRNSAIRAIIYNRLSSIRRENALFTTIVRLLYHVPALPLYAATFALGSFGYYDTRIPASTLRSARKIFAQNDRLSGEISLKSKWYKQLEYYAINKHPEAVPRMYNYLVISGLFRSLSFIFLTCCWLIIYYQVHYLIHGDWLLKPIAGFKDGHVALLEYLAMLTLYAFCLFSYLKFQRRYAEETIFAFVYNA